MNVGADFCMMPSVFEPGGIVQQEFFVAGTPVIAFRTGGLKDPVRDWDPATRQGTGFTFETHSPTDFQAAVCRALAIFRDEAVGGGGGGAYATMRANARASVIDLSVVSRAWFREFHRIRRCLPPEPAPPPARVRTSFSLRPGDVPPGVALTAASGVGVAGAWNGWRPALLPLRFVPDGGEGRGAFVGSAELPPGAHAFKFVVDGQWLLLPDRPSVKDDAGNVNNVVVVMGAPDH